MFKELRKLLTGRDFRLIIFNKYSTKEESQIRKLLMPSTVRFELCPFLRISG